MVIVDHVGPLTSVPLLGTEDESLALDPWVSSNAQWPTSPGRGGTAASTEGPGATSADTVASGGPGGAASGRSGPSVVLPPGASLVPRPGPSVVLPPGASLVAPSVVSGAVLSGPRCGGRPRSTHPSSMLRPRTIRGSWPTTPGKSTAQRAD